VSERDSYRFDLGTKQKTWNMCVSTISKLHLQISSGRIQQIGWTYATSAFVHTLLRTFRSVQACIAGTATVDGEYVYVQNYDEANREQITQEAREIVEWLAQQSKRKGKVLLIGYNSNRFDILLLWICCGLSPTGATGMVTQA